jgi:hypothetical protein
MSNDKGIKIVSVVSGVSSEFDILFDVIYDMAASMLFENFEAVGMIIF